MTLLQVIIYKLTTRWIINTGPQLEATYAAAVEAVCRERDTRLNELEQRHTRWNFAVGLLRLVFVLLRPISFLSRLAVSFDREMTETVAAATGQDNPGAVSEHDVNALAAHQV